MWFPLLGSIAAWAVHLVLLTAVVRISCTDEGWVAVMHWATAATLAVTAAAAVLSLRLARSGVHPLRFIGRLGLLFAAVNGLLIVVEELLVLGLGSQRCA